MLRQKYKGNGADLAYGDYMQLDVPNEFALIFDCKLHTNSSGRATCSTTSCGAPSLQ